MNNNLYNLYIIIHSYLVILISEGNVISENTVAAAATFFVLVCLLIGLFCTQKTSQNSKLMK